MTKFGYWLIFGEGTTNIWSTSTNSSPFGSQSGAFSSKRVTNFDFWPNNDQFWFLAKKWPILIFGRTLTNFDFRPDNDQFWFLAKKWPILVRMPMKKSPIWTSFGPFSMPIFQSQFSMDGWPNVQFRLMDHHQFWARNWWAFLFFFFFFLWWMTIWQQVKWIVHKRAGIETNRCRRLLMKFRQPTNRWRKRTGSSASSASSASSSSASSALCGIRQRGMSIALCFL